MSCKKCDLPKTVILRKRDYYCDDCFTSYTNHKFRACLGKSKVLTPNENVLICSSGGVGSTVLLDLIHYSVSLENTKKLRIVPHVLHLLYDDAKETAEFVQEQCHKYNFDVYMLHMSEYLNKNHQLPQVNCIPEANQEVESQFQRMLKSMPSTAANDFLLKIKRSLFVEVAKLLQCKFVFTAEATNTLAINLLCNIATGRGSQVQNDIGFLDIRDEKVKILRPIKDISKEELDYYITLKQLRFISDCSLKNDNSLQSLISSFVCDLQENSQNTISTVCKTADKIGDLDDIKIKRKCILCKSDLNAISKMSALEATRISRTLSSRINETDSNIESHNLEDETSVFPLVYKYLCYGCSRNHSEMSSPSLPHHLEMLIP